MAPHDSHHSANQMYALRLHAAHPAGARLAGQIEHVLSGQRMDFADALQLLAALQQLQDQAHAQARCRAQAGAGYAASGSAIRPPAA